MIEAFKQSMKEVLMTEPDETPSTEKKNEKEQYNIEDFEDMQLSDDKKSDK